MTWFIQIGSGVIYKIQLNLFRIVSWAQIFLVYHTDLVCIGYEVLTNKFIYMKGRFDNIIRKNIHYFSNIFNFDSGISLHLACDKYIRRGFSCQMIFLPDPKRQKAYADIGLIEALIMKYYEESIYIMSGNSLSDDRIDLNYLPHVLCGGSKDYAMAPSVTHLCSKSEVMVPLIYLSVFMIDRYPERHQYLNIKRAKEIFYMPEKINRAKNKNYYVGVKCHCGSTWISLNNYSFHDDKNCTKKCKRSNYIYNRTNDPSRMIFSDYARKPDLLII